MCDSIQANFSRIQFTPDLLPADVIGTVIYNSKTGESGRRSAGPRTRYPLTRTAPASGRALPEAMQERQVTIGDTTYKLLQIRSSCSRRRTPSSKKAPIRQAEAQPDRFMLMVKVGYPHATKSARSADRMTRTLRPRPTPGRHLS
ncbi:MAG: AAA family ATPase [Polyangiaceae bacterium]